MSSYPTQAFVREQISAGKWPAREGEILDIRSLSDKEIKIIELYNQEEIIKQQRITNRLLAEVLRKDEQPEESPKKKPRSLKAKVVDLLDDGELNGSSGGE